MPPPESPARSLRRWPLRRASSRLCNFQISAAGGIATISPITVARTLGGSQVFSGHLGWWRTVRATAVYAMLAVRAQSIPPLPSPQLADGTATAVDVQASGYQR